MSTKATDKELVDSLVDYVEDGIWPTNEDVASATLPKSALPILLKGIKAGQDTVKAELRQLSRNTAGDVDGWISQAKQLQHDIEESKTVARQILEESEKSKSLLDREKDAASKADLLRNELDFNETLIGALEQIQIATSLLDKAREAESENELVQAVRELDNAQRVTAGLNSLQNSRFGGLLSRRAAQVKDGLSSRTSKYWSSMVTASHDERKITVKTEANIDDVEVSLSETSAAMKELGTLELHISRFYRDLNHVIMEPRFSEAADGAHANINFTDNEISLSGRSESQDLGVLSGDVKQLVSFFQDRLPEDASAILLQRLLPNLLIQLVNEQLDPSVPTDIDELVTYSPSLEHIQNLATFMDHLGFDMPSDGNLSEWIERLAQNWLSRRREAALAAMRAECFEAVKHIKTAERVETQMISSDDVMAAGEQQDDGWNEDWDESAAEQSNDADGAKEAVKSEEDGEEAEGWGWGDGDDGDGEEKHEKEVHESVQVKDQQPGQDDDNTEDWDNWGGGEDETEAEATTNATETSKLKQPAKAALKSPATTKTPAKPKQVTQTEMTLRESFQITAIPDTLVDLIKAVLSDADKVSQPSFPIAEIRAAAVALSPIPTLLLALYRATARSIYSSSAVADILIYNDSSELATRLEQLLVDLPSDHVLARRLPRAIETEVQNLQSFSRLAYGREMDSQRTILSDLLSSTSGFESCTNPLNAREYHAAIDDVVARLLEVDALWKDVLCESARKQSLGALLSHVIRKLVSDILELASEPAGISEPESKQLRAYLDKVAELSKLFDAQGPDGEVRTLVHVYTPAWFRFQYLGEILEASLADIKFLWTEGELSLEFDADEVVELIQALFAESEHRRGAIREIRRGGHRA